MSYINQPQGTYHEKHADPEVYKEGEKKSVFELLKKFDEFLREFSAFDDFYSMQNSEGFTSPELNADEPESFISAGFAWSNSERGSKYWREVSDAWYSYLNEHPALFNVAPQIDNTRAMAVRGAEVLNQALDFIVSSKSRDVAVWAVANALGTACCEGVKCSDRAAKLNVSPQALSKQTREFADMIGIEPVYGYDKQ
jgi:hypothetical protein